MASQTDVARAFAGGKDPDEIPSASNFMAAKVPDNDEFEAVLLSYGWAVVFGRRPNGTVVEFTGWQGYSASTSTQIGKARRAITGVLPDSDFETDKRQPKKGGGLSWRVRGSGAEPL